MFYIFKQKLESPLAPIFIISSNRGICTIKGAEIRILH